MGEIQVLTPLSRSAGEGPGVRVPSRSGARPVEGRYTPFSRRQRAIQPVCSASWPLRSGASP